MRTPSPCVLPDQPTSLAQLIASGMSREMVATQVSSGWLVRIRRGVYVAATAWPSDAAGRHVLLAKAEQVVHPAAVLSHASAALVWSLPSPGFSPWHESPPTVTIPVTVGAKSRNGAVVHRLARLPASQVTRDKEGWAVTTVARTAVDLAAGLPLPSSLVLLDAASRILVEQMVTTARRQDYASPRIVHASRELLWEAARFRRTATLASDIALCDARRESAAESLSAGHFHMAGLPAPELQTPIRTRTGTYFPGFYWREYHLIGECDGAMKYAETRDLVAEKVREDSLRELGNTFVRWLGRDIMTDPAGVVGRVSRGLGM